MTRVASLALLVALLLSALAPPGARAAGPELSLPTVMAAVGDSITQAASTGGSLGADAPQNSWATGTTASVNSHYLRLVGAGATSLARHNLSVSGAKMANLPDQTAAAAAVSPDYLTVLIGGNDVCTSTVAGMTDPIPFEADFRAALANLDHQRTHVYVVSIPRVMGLWELFRNNWWARFIWSTAGICQSLLANPTSTNQADVARRAEVDARNRAFNEILARVCSETPNCHHDGGAAFNTTFTTSDVSGDYFHPSAAGQAKLAAVSWAAGYAWASTPPENAAPSASFTSACEALTCAFDASASSDSDGSITSYAWTFGDGASGSGKTASRTYASAGTYPITLTVTDNGGKAAVATGSVTVSAPAGNEPPTAAFSATCSGLSCSFTDASHDADGTVASRSWSFGDGGTSSATNPSHSYAAGGTFTVTLTVTDDDDATATAVQSVTVTAPTAPAIELTVRAYKVKGLQKADLSWSGATTTSVVVFRNGVAISTTPNDGFHTDPINAKGGGTYRYRICETGGGPCSPEVTASY